MSGIVSQLQIVAYDLEHVLPEKLRQIDAMIAAGEREILRLQRILEVSSPSPIERSCREPDILPFDRMMPQASDAPASVGFGDESRRRAA